MAGPTEYPTTGSASIRVEASPADAYGLVTDLTRLPTLSPENVRCEFTGDNEVISVGATFKGHNKAGDYEWSADCVVLSAEPGREFSFQVPPDWEYATVWTYRFEPDGDGVVVTESFDSPMLGDPDVYPGEIHGRCEQLRGAIEITLANLKAALEA